ncbi:hypothetical protein [Streptomyces sp. Y7]|uniref:hypothetical protein n=1 Tax=Streptomyces sp. Y7 TaxID=3342392 RepID=UPI0037232382
MEAQYVADLINQISFRPGWEFRADVMVEGESFVIVQALVETVNSDRDQALNGYPERILLAPAVIFDADDFVTADGLYAAMIQWIIDMEIHECREFFRVGPDKQAPFHPHRPEGQSAWAEIATDPVVHGT